MSAQATDTVLARTHHRCVICQRPILPASNYRRLSAREKAHVGCEWPWDALRNERIEIRRETAS